VSDYLVGPALEEAERSGEELKVIWPFSADAGSVLVEDQDIQEDKERWAKSKDRRRRDTPGVTDWTAIEALL
jgi:actin-related protein 9